MRVVVPFEAGHVLAMMLQPKQAWIAEYLNERGLRSLENEWAVTLLDDGAPIAAVGPIALHKERALIWSFLSDRMTPAVFLEAHLLARRYLDGLPFRRLEAAIDVTFEAGHRWAKSLGFVCEAERMTAYELDGRDCALYARVRT